MSEDRSSKEFVSSNLCCIQRIRLDPYMNFYVFWIMFENACKSEDYEFRYYMSRVIDKLFHPSLNQGGRLWARVWISNSHVINADHFINLKLNLKRVRLLERLRIIRLFSFQGTNLQGKTIMVDGVEHLQNRYVYDKLIKVVPADQVFVADIDKEGLPE